MFPHICKALGFSSSLTTKLKKKISLYVSKGSRVLVDGQRAWMGIRPVGTEFLHLSFEQILPRCPA